MIPPLFEIRRCLYDTFGFYFIRRMRTSTAALRLLQRFDKKRSGESNVVSGPLPAIEVNQFLPVTYNWFFRLIRSCIRISFSAFYKIPHQTPLFSEYSHSVYLLSTGMIIPMKA